MSNYSNKQPMYKSSTNFIYPPSENPSNVHALNDQSHFWYDDENTMQGNSFNYQVAHNINPNLYPPPNIGASHSMNINLNISNAHESLYDNIGIQYQSLDSAESAALFCMLCECPMIIRVRLNSCFHLLCYECFQTSVEANSNECPICKEKCHMGTIMHPEDLISVCSGECFRNRCSEIHNESRIPGRAFLSVRSLKCHEMFFHSQANTAQPSEISVSDVNEIHSSNQTNPTYCHDDIVNL